MLTFENKIWIFFFTFLGSDAGLYPRAAVAMETVDQGIKLKLMELFFLEYEYKLHDFTFIAKTMAHQK